MTYKTTIEIIHAIFFLLFLYSGVYKLIHYSEYTSELAQYPFVTSMLVRLAWIVPIIELSIPLAFLMHWMPSTVGKREWLITPGVTLTICFSLMLLFTIFLIFLSTFPVYLPCSCGGWLERLPLSTHIILNGTLTLISLLGVYLNQKITTQRKLWSKNI